MSAKKEKVMVQLDPAVRGELDKIADRYGLTGNTLLAAVGYEVSRIPAEQLWERLARISAEERHARPALAGARS